MDVRDVEALVNYFDRCGWLNDHYNRDLLEDAIYQLNHGNEYRARTSLKTLSANLYNEGYKEACKHIDRLL